MPPGPSSRAGASRSRSSWEIRLCHLFYDSPQNRRRPEKLGKRETQAPELTITRETSEESCLLIAGCRGCLWEHSHPLHCLFPRTQIPLEWIKLVSLKEVLSKCFEKKFQREKKSLCSLQHSRRTTCTWAGLSVSYKGISHAAMGRRPWSRACTADVQDPEVTSRLALFNLYRVIKSWVRRKHLKIGRFSVKYGFLASLAKMESQQIGWIWGAVSTFTWGRCCISTSG